MTRALQSLGHHPLMLGAGPGLLRRHDFGVWAHKAADKLGVFIIDIGNFFRTEQTGFFGEIIRHKS